MRLSILTIEPALFDSFLASHVIRRAVSLGQLQIEIVDIRNFAGGSFRHIDDSPIGGGNGMILRCGPILKALEYAKGRGSSQDCGGSKDCGGSQDCGGSNTQEAPQSTGQDTQVLSVVLTPRGQTWTQAMAHSFATREHLILICGHYEGIDERVFPHVDREVSIGDYVLTGGELAAQVLADSVVRLLPGVLRAGSTREESFEQGLLEYPQYTQPADYEGNRVPDVLLSGNHAAIRKWRQEQAERLTRARRPDLLREDSL